MVGCSISFKTRHLITKSFKSSTGPTDHFSCKSSPSRSHLVAQKSTWQGEPFELSKNKDFSEVLVILSTLLQRYNQFIISLGVSDMINTVQMLVSHQVGGYQLIKPFTHWVHGLNELWLVGELVFCVPSCFWP